MKERKLTCIICPRGCELAVTLGDEGEIVEIRGNACPRGKVYAETECTSPMRTVTTTVRTEDGAVIPVKTAAPVPKGAIFEVMKHINRTVAPSDISVGDTVIGDAASTGVAVIVTGKRP